MRIIFLGTPAFAAYSLQRMADSGYEIVAVVTAPDKPAGRGMKMHESEVKKTALKLGIPLLQPTNLKDPAFISALRSLQADLGVVIAFRMLPEVVWSMPRLGTMNLHASLLPDYRGAAPINHAIINGETHTGVTTFFLKHEIDTGDIVLQEAVPILPEDNAGSLHDKLMIAGADLVLRTLKLVEQGHWESQPQVLTGGLKQAPKITPEFCKLDGHSTALQALNKVRGLSPYPGAWLPDGSMKVFNASIAPPTETGIKHGLVVSDKEGKLYWPFADGWLELIEIQPQGKRRMHARDYINGLKNKG